MDGQFDPRKQLEKHGWKQGSGLGREEHGIKEAIKVKIKQDMAGVGHDPAEEFTYHWWDHVFNKAANSIQVENSEHGVKVKQDGDCHVSRKKSGVKKLTSKPMLYGMFVKSSTLTNEGLEVKEPKSDSDSSDSEAEDIGTASKHTDEELFKLCGGLTGHKAARHGHGLGGKLQRIALQEEAEALLLSQRPLVNGQDTQSVVLTPPDSPTCEPRKRKKSKKEKREKKTEEVDATDLVLEDAEQTADAKTKKKKKKSKKNKNRHLEDAASGCTEIVDSSETLTESSTGDVDSEPKSKKCKKRKEKNQESMLDVDDSEPKTKKCKKRKEKYQESMVDVDDSEPEHKTKKCKKRKEKHIESAEDSNEIIVKKQKKKKTKRDRSS